MPIRFAAARPATTAHFGKQPRQMGAFRPANNNPCTITNAALLRATLLHFAQHGLAAAAIARDNAARALGAGDAAGHEHWFDICAALDRRMAQGLNHAANAS